MLNGVNIAGTVRSVCFGPYFVPPCMSKSAATLGDKKRQTVVSSLDDSPTTFDEATSSYSKAATSRVWLKSAVTLEYSRIFCRIEHTRNYCSSLAV
jgi:hypothetical protein